MTRIALFASLLLVASATAQPTWETVDLGTTEDLLALSTLMDPPWVVGTNGFVARATSDLTVWTTFDLGTDTDLVSVTRYPVASGRVYIGGRAGAVWYTFDGSSWLTHDIPDTPQDYVLRYNGGLVAFGSEGDIRTSFNAVPPWTVRASGTTVSLNDAFLRGDTFIAVGDEGTILRSTLQAETWTTVESGTTADLHAIAAIAGDVWVAVGEGGVVLKSTDNALTWSPRDSGTTATLYGLSEAGFDFLTVGEGGMILKSETRGDTWCYLDAGTTATLYTSTRLPQNRWLVAGEGGLLLQAQFGALGTCRPVASEASGPEAGYTLSAVWPNPMTERAALTLSVDRPQHVRVELVDALGRCVQTLHDGLATPGRTVPLHAEVDDLAPGVYVVHVQGETFTTTRSLTLAR